MNRKLVFVSLIMIPLLALFATSCGCRNNVQEQLIDVTRKTLTQFLEMCKQGKTEEAMQRYVDPSQKWEAESLVALDNIADYAIDSIMLDPTSRPVAVISVSTNTAIETVLIFTCSEDGKALVYFQPDPQPNVEKQARKTVADFLELCREGKSEEAVGKYCRALNLFISIDPLGLEDLVSYTVSGVASVRQGSSECLAVLADLQVGDKLETSTETWCIFLLTADGLTILSNDPNIKLAPEDQAKLTVSSFLEMCKDGPSFVAVGEYISGEDTYNRTFNLPTYLPILNDVASYYVGDAVSDNSSSRVTATLLAWNERAELEFICSQDGKGYFGIEVKSDVMWNNEIEMKTMKHIPFEGITSPGLIHDYPTYPFFTVITNQTEYARAISRTRWNKDAPEIDFSKDFALVVGDMTNDSGYHLYIHSVVQSGSRVFVEYEVYTSNPEMGAAQVIGYEYRSILLKRDSLQPDGELKFILVDRYNNQYAEVTTSV